MGSGIGRSLERWRAIRLRGEPEFARPVSQACTYRQTRTPEYRQWCAALRQPYLCHRKQWEWCFILQALETAGAIRPGARGLGFGVGVEPLVAYLASRGCEIVATDLPTEDSRSDRWTETAQHASELGDLNQAELCPDAAFRERVTFRPVDMNQIPTDLRDFDFTWSSCAMEHLGDLEAGARFFLEQANCLRAGGVGVHTTEFNVESDEHTVERGDNVLYRRRDLEALVQATRAAGSVIESNFTLGRAVRDRHVDRPPWSKTHLRVEIDGYITTSFGLIVRRPAAP